MFRRNIATTAALILGAGIPLAGSGRMCRADVPPRAVVLVPVEAHVEPGDVKSASVGTITDSGDEIILENGGASVWLEIRVGDWDADDVGVKLVAWDAAVDSSGFSSGTEGILTFKSPECESDADCEEALGRGTSGVGPPFLCFLPVEAPKPTNCTPGFLDTSRADYITPGLVSFVDPRRSYFGGADLAGKDAPEPFPARGFYAGTIVLEVPPDAKGTFTVGLKSIEFIDQNLAIIPMVANRPAKITVRTDQGDGTGLAAARDTPPREKAISTVLAVGLIVPAIFLLAGAMIHFGRRRARKTGLAHRKTGLARRERPA